MSRLKVILAIGLISLSAVLFAWSFSPPAGNSSSTQTVDSEARVHRDVQEMHLQRAPRSFDGDLRSLPFEKPAKKERPEREPPPRISGTYGTAATITSAPATESLAQPSAPAPTPSKNFAGLDYATWG